MVVTNVGPVSLTENQILSWVASGVWKKFSYTNGEVIAVSESTPSQQDIDALIAELQSLPDTVPMRIIIQSFDSAKAIARQPKVFTAAEMARLMPYAYGLNEMIRYKNFWGGVENGVPYPGLKQVVQQLVSDTKIEQGDYDKLNNILKEQGIDLDM